MFNENDIALLLAVVFGFICGWIYFWCIFKPKQKQEHTEDFSGDRILIASTSGMIVVDISVAEACMKYRMLRAPLVEVGGYRISYIERNES